MSDSLYDRYGRRLVGGTILGLAILSVASGLVRLQDAGLVAVGDILVSLYVAGLALWGLFREGFDTPRFRTALYAGLVLWGAVDVLAGDPSAVSYVLLFGGLVLFARSAYRYRRDRDEPVSER